MKKKLAVLGMVAGILAIIFGIIVLTGVFGAATSGGSSSPYDSGFASFGGDYYTYSVNNAAEAASAARAVAYNLRDISGSLNAIGGLLLIFFGLTAFCGFGIVFAGCERRQTPVVTEAISEVEDNEEIVQDIEMEQPSEEPVE